MAAADLPSISPSYSSPGKCEATVHRNEFGDGYAQRATPGLNSVKQTWDIFWHCIPIADADTLWDFFELQAGVELITWTPPRQSVELQWTCKSWSRVPGTSSGDMPNHDDVSATLVQEFDPT